MSITHVKLYASCGLCQSLRRMLAELIHAAKSDHLRGDALDLSIPWFYAERMRHTTLINALWSH